MAILQLQPHLTVEQLKERMDQETKVRFFRRWQILHVVATHRGIKAQRIASLLSTSIAVVRRTVQLYNKCGADFMHQRLWGGRREQRCLMSLKQEEELLGQLKARALKGEVVVAKQLRSLVEEKTACKVSEDYLWDLLHRHDWSKKAPRPQHPKADEKVKEQREAFKKSTRTLCKAGK